jgi:hypothetical protein
MKRKTCIIRTWKKHLYLNISTNIDTLVPSLHQCVKIRSIEIFLLLSQPLPHLRFIDFRTSLREFFDPLMNRFTWQTLSTVNRTHLFINIVCVESFCPQKTHNKFCFSSIVLKHGLLIDYWNQPLNMRMRFCYLGWHEVGLCCYLVIHIGNLLHTLQLFYFHLWPVYWLSLVS